MTIRNIPQPYELLVIAVAIVPVGWVVYQWVNQVTAWWGWNPRHPLTPVLTPADQADPAVAVHLAAYPVLIRRLLAVNLGYTVAGVIGWTIYNRVWPVREGSALDALRLTMELLLEKRHHLQGRLTPEELARLDAVVNEVVNVLNAGVAAVAPPPTGLPLWVYLVLALVAAAAVRGGRATVVIPAWDQLSGAAWVRLLLPVVLMVGVTVVAVQWWRSGDTVYDHLRRRLGDPVVAVGRVNLYTRVIGWGSPIVAGVQWLTVLEMFRGKYFAGIGATRLRETPPPVGDTALTERYYAVVEQVTALEHELNGWYPNGVDPVSGLWWLPLVRTTFIGVVALGVWWGVRSTATQQRETA